jgi:arabinogalactan oligomer/maltooligosaccharide transport system permease protein
VRRAGGPWTAPASLGLVGKLLLLAAVNGVALLGLPRMVGQGQWGLVAGVVLATAAIDVVYLSRARAVVPLRYLLPGTILLCVFQLYPVLYTFYTSFTNWSTAHNLSKEQAIELILARSEAPRPDAPRYRARPLVDPEGRLALHLTDPQGRRFLGTSRGLRPLGPGEVREGPAGVAVGAYRQLSLAEAAARQEELLGLRVPTPEGSIRLNTVTTATVATPTLRYEPGRDVMVNVETGKVYRAVEGRFVAEDGEALSPGWRVVVGFDNYVRAFTSPAIRGPFLRAFVWNYVFATSTVFLQFALGLALALALNHPRLAGRRAYRSLLVIPFALPSYLTSLIWAGLLNQQFGPVNRLLGTDLDWLGDPRWFGLLPKSSILLVTMWLGFPYFFLVSTGALQAIPAEYVEAAAVDGASGWYTFRRVTLPLLLTAVAPLLVASFAYNFNNFNTIYLLTRGGPPIAGAQTPAGHTDILITYTYRLAFEVGQGAQFGFATSISVLIFAMVMAISLYGYRRTRALEQVQ